VVLRPKGESAPTGDAAQFGLNSRGSGYKLEDDGEPAKSVALSGIKPENDVAAVFGLYRRGC
jgi:hypothetical protein